ncbi:MAG: 16S rRNA (guanine(527)-N(7))-methyltransferase RsmG [Lentisphaeria bacterium]|nr:16S rRNA (guanine(527)-N(7))-methyltransferase RsmG [Lentisphaeria bacterium]
MNFPSPSEEVHSFFRKCLNGEPDLFIEKMGELGSFLYETNEHLNLTAIKAEKFWSLHAGDSLSPVLFFPEFFHTPSRILDLGCGAGFPSLVLAAAFPQINITALDSTRKKIDFVNSAAKKLALSNLQGVHGRGNELARKPPFRANYDVVFARAVAAVEILIREALGFLKPGGSLIVFRTPEQYNSELNFLKKWKKGSYKVTEIFELPDRAGSRMFLQIKQMREMH